ncbi:MAG: hypothetical protein AABM31_12500 [Actinomycetota bacterium]
MRWRTPRSAVVVAIVGSVVALQLGDARPAPPVAESVVVAADGDLDLQNSLGDAPVLSASGLGPGDSATGQVTVTNLGTGSGALSLERQTLTDTPGAGGGNLSERLQLVVHDVTNALSPTTVYTGALGAMPEKELGPMGPGQVRIYRFDASFPEGGSADNAYAGAATSVGYRWTVASGSTPEPPGNPGGSKPGGSKPTTPGGTVPGPGFVRPGLKLKVAIKKAPLLKKKTLTVRVRCTHACAITARAHVGIKKAKKPLGKTSAVRKEGKPGRWVTLELKLSKRTLAKVKWAVAARKKMVVKVTVTAKTATGAKAKTVKSISLR